MRVGLLWILLGTMSGCAVSRSSGPAASARPVYRDAPAAALAFNPPATYGEAPIFLSRDERMPALFLGFDDLTTTFYYLRTDDRQGTDGFDHTYRRAISERVGISYR